jgi:hypothetical protein
MDLRMRKESFKIEKKQVFISNLFRKDKNDLESVCNNILVIAFKFLSKLNRFQT